MTGPLIIVFLVSVLPAIDAYIAFETGRQGAASALVLALSGVFVFAVLLSGAGLLSALTAGGVALLGYVLLFVVLDQVKVYTERRMAEEAGALLHADGSHEAL